MSRPSHLTLPSSPEPPSCDTHVVHLDQVRQVQPELLAMPKAQQMAEFFSVLSDPNRLRLISALATQELCVCDLAATLRMGESAVSHQLRVLRSFGASHSESHRLVSYRRVGRNVYYRLADHHVFNLYQEVTAHLNQSI